MFYYTTHPSPVGRLTLACDETALVGLWLEGQKYHGGTILKDAMPSERPIFTDAKNWLDAYFNGEKPAISQLKLAPIGSDFRQRIWEILCQIPYGKVITYGDIAAQIGSSMSSQAVGGAVGHNPISVIIPCHRVVGKTGSLTGYAGGVQAKIKLLTLEGADMSRLFVPAKGTAL